MEMWSFRIKSYMSEAKAANAANPVNTKDNNVKLPTYIS